MQRQEPSRQAPQAQDSFDWEAFLENAGITGLTFSTTGLVSGRPLATPALGAVTGIVASRGYGGFFQAGRNRHGEQDYGKMLGLASTNTLFIVLAMAYKVDPMAALLVTMVLAASLIALSKVVPHPDNAPTPTRRPGQG